MDPVPLNHPMFAGGIARVIKSASEHFKEGDLVQGLINWQEYGVHEDTKLKKVPPYEFPQHYISIFGGTSLTAYFGLKEIGKPKSGETLVVSAAAGATGSVVCQLGKAWGMSVVGIAGAADKCKWVEKDLGIPCINYKTAGKNLRDEIKKACPNGIDVFFDNVGGEQLDTVFPLMNDFGRIVACGAISAYNNPEASHGLKNYTNVITKRLAYQGFIVLDYLHRTKEAIDELTSMLAKKQLHIKEDI